MVKRRKKQFIKQETEMTSRYNPPLNLNHNKNTSLRYHFISPIKLAKINISGQYQLLGRMWSSVLVLHITGV